MTNWFPMSCHTLAPAASAILGIVCLALGGVVLFLIMLGFGPLRSWIGLADNSYHPRRGLLHNTESLRMLWCLWRAAGRNQDSVFSASDVPSAMVPGIREA
jgi:hypothetical protein